MKTDAKIDDSLAALADPTRRAVIDLLRKKSRRAGELAEMCDLSAPAMSRHLRVLRKTGLVEEESDADDARIRVYRLKREPFQKLQHWLDDVCAAWGAELDAFKTYAESGKDSTKRGKKSRVG